MVEHVKRQQPHQLASSPLPTAASIPVKAGPTFLYSLQNDYLPIRQYESRSAQPYHRGHYAYHSSDFPRYRKRSPTTIVTAQRCIRTFDTDKKQFYRNKYQKGVADLSVQ